MKKILKKTIVMLALLCAGASINVRAAAEGEIPGGAAGLPPAAADAPQEGSEDIMPPECLEMIQRLTALLQQHENDASKALNYALKNKLDWAIIPLVQVHGAKADNYDLIIAIENQTQETKNENLKTIKRLINAGVDPNFTTEGSSNLTPLIRAAQKGRTDIVKVLLDAGAHKTIDYQEKNANTGIGSTALMSAASQDNAQMVQLLLDAGADITITDRYGRTAYDLATNPEIKKLLEIGG
jgi:hypothetical protein